MLWKLNLVIVLHKYYFFLHAWLISIGFKVLSEIESQL